MGADQACAPGRDETVGVTAQDHRLFVEAVLYRYRAGIPWRDLPERCGDWKNMHRRHRRWSESGVWQQGSHTSREMRTTHTPGSMPRLSASIRTLLGQKGDKNTACIGRRKGGLTTQIPAACEALGNPTGLHVTPGQARDLAGADVFLPARLASRKAWLADKASDAQKRVLDLLACAGVQAVIPPRKNRKLPRVYDEDMDKARHLIENFFAQLKQCRGLATRYDKRAKTFLGAVSLAAAIIWLN